MDQGSRIYRQRYNLPIHTAPMPCQPRPDDVAPLRKMSQGRLIACRIGSLLTHRGCNLPPRVQACSLATTLDA